MSHFYRVNGTFRPNFLESEVGLVLKTYQIPNTMGVADEYGNKIVAAGTVYPLQRRKRRRHRVYRC